MTPQQILGAGIRLFAVWLALSCIAYFSAIPSALSASAVESGDSIMASRVVGVLYVIAALLLWFFPMAVAHKLLPKTSHFNSLNIHGFELARAGAGLLGLWLVAKALPTLSWVVFRAFLFVDMGSNFSALPPEMKLEVAVAVFELLLGLFFVLKSGLLARTVMKADGSRAPSQDEF